MPPAPYVAFRLVPMGVAGVGNLLLARQLEPGAYGQIAAAYAVAQILVAVGIFGYDQLLLQRAIKPVVALRRAVGVVVVSGSLALCVGVMFVDVVPVNVLVPVLLSTSLLQLLAVLLCAAQAADLDLYRSGIDAAVRSSSQIGLNAGASLGGTPGAAAWAGVAGVLVAIGGVAALTPRRMVARLWNDSPERAPHTRGAFRSVVGYGAIGLLFTAAIAILGLAVALGANAVENANTRIVLLAYGVEVAVSSALTGEYFRTRLYRARTVGERELVRRRLWRAVLMTVPAVTGGMLVASVFIPAFLGDAYAGTRFALLVLAAGVWAHYVQAALASLFITAGMTRVSVARQSMVLGLVVVGVLVLDVNVRTVALILLASDALGVTFYGLVRWSNRTADGPGQWGNPEG